MASPNVFVRIKWYPKNPARLKKKSKAQDYRSFLENGGFNYCNNDEKTNPAFDGFKYLNNRPGSTGCFNKYGPILEADVPDIKKQISSTKSIIWDCIISFEEKYGHEHCSTKEDAMQLLQRTLPELFNPKYNNKGLSYDNIQWYAALHLNKKNHYHIHLHFWEKEPIHASIDQNGYSFLKNGTIPKSATNNFTFKIAEFFAQPQFTNSYALFDALKDDFSSLLHNTEYQALFHSIYDLMKDSGSFQYGRQSRNTQSQIKKAILFLISQNPNLKKQYDDYKAELFASQKELTQLYIDSHKELTPQIKHYAATRLDDLYYRLGNLICKHIKAYSDYFSTHSPVHSINEQIQKNKALLSEKELSFLQSLFDSSSAERIDLFYNNYDHAFDSADYSFATFAYKIKEGKLVSFCSLLATELTKNQTTKPSFSAEDKATIKHIVRASSFFTPAIDNKVSPVNFQWCKDKIHFASQPDQSILDTAIEIACSNIISNYVAKMQLPKKSSDIPPLTAGDNSLLQKILNKQNNHKYIPLFTSEWDNSFQDVSGSLKNIYIQQYKLIGLLSRYTNDADQIVRIFKNTPLYRKELWNMKYSKAPIDFIPINELAPNDGSFGETVLNFCLSKYTAARSFNQKMNDAWKSKSFSSVSEKRKRFLYDQNLSRFCFALSSALQNDFSNTFIHLQKALQDQKRKRLEQGMDIDDNDMSADTSTDSGAITRG